MKRCGVDICCVRERVRWKDHRARMIGNGFKFLWSEGSKVETGVGVVVSNRLIEKDCIKRYCDRLTK